MNAIWRQKYRIITATTSLLLVIVLLVSVLIINLSGTLAADVPTATKSAQVNNGAIANGTSANPVPVNLGDEIKYTIKVNMPATVTPTPRYDVLFVLDWSASMNSGYDAGQMGTTTSNDDWSARLRARSTIRTLSQQIFAAYPDSRIALMGLNSNDRNTGDVRNTYIQVDTDFVGSSQYASVIQNAFQEQPYLRFDDGPVFLRAAIDKLRGNAATYGGAASPYGGNAAPSMTVNARTNMDRIPVIVFISDFQFGMGDFGTPSRGGNWSDFDTQVSNFKSYYSNGILLAARADTNESLITYGSYFGTSAHDVKMNNSFITMGGTQNGQNRWGWVKFGKNQTQAYQDSLLFDLIQNKAPAPSTATTVTDLLPAGLEYVSSSPDGTKTTVGGRDKVVWDLSSLPTGNTTVTVTARVKEYGTYANTADVAITGYNSIATNPTYHKATAPPVIPPSAVKTAKVLPNGSTASGTAQSPVAIQMGEQVEYTITVSNPNGAASGSVTDLLPAGLEYISSSPAGVKTTENGRDKIVWGLSSIPTGNTVLKVTAKVTGYGTYINTADIAIDGYSTVTTNATYHRATAPSVTPPSAVKTAKVLPNGSTASGTSASPVTVQLGEQVEYTITVSNPNGAASGSVTDLLPAGLEYVSSSPAGTKTTVGGRDQIAWNLSNIPTGDTTVTVIAKVVGYGTYTNTADIAIDGYSTVTTNPTYHKATEPPAASPAAVKSAKVLPNGSTASGTAESPVAVQVGDQIEYTVTVNNPGAATNGLIIDQLPAGLKVVSTTPSVTPTNADGRDQVVWLAASLPTGSTTFKITAEVMEHGTFENVAYVMISTNDTIITNSTYHRATDVPAVPPSAVKSAEVLPNGSTASGTLGSPVAVQLGDEIAYTITVNNPNGTANGSVTDLLPAGLEYVGSSPAGTKTTVGGRDQLAWNLSSIPTGDTTVTVITKVVGYGTYVNTADIAITGFDSVTTNPTYHRAEAPATPPSAIKSAQVLPDGSTASGTPGSPIAVQFGDEIMYTITVSNPNGTASGSVTDLLPEGLEYVSSSPAGTKTTVSGRDQVVWSLSSIPTGDTVLTVTVKAVGYGTYANTADVVIDGYSPVTTNSTYHKAEDTTGSSLTVVKTAKVLPGGSTASGTAVNPVAVQIGDQIEYTITVNNPNGETMGFIFDYLPAGLEYVSSSPAATSKTVMASGETQVSWFYNSLPSGSTVVKVTAMVMENGTFENIGSFHYIIGGNSVDSNPTYHRATDAPATIYRLHIRQIVLERQNSTVELPRTGYMRLSNNNIISGITTAAGVHGVGTTTFTEYIVVPSPSDPVITVTDILPQYYEYAGYIATLDNAGHDPGARQTGDVALDYGAETEYWVTVYIRPRATVPGSYTWSFWINFFGRIFDR
jgi:uncharacterized repeat protein (TIGR01451 family)